ncbi:MAG TPA: arylamine N-acetyltransferase [Ktedonobacteraceae bacterium]|nr:arylamine N-acetyltransferase [Ktedonobacteraceae bacterium]
MDIQAYLKRIDYHGPSLPTFQTLAELQEAHLLAVPFENLNISLGRTISLDEKTLFHKIVTQRRGGFCYELNGLFAALLQALGFQVSMLSAGVAQQEGGFGPEFDHMALLVQLEGSWLVDVGFGDSFYRPLPLEEWSEHIQADYTYRLLRNGSYWTLQRRPDSTTDEAWENQYRFTLQAHQLGDYTEMCHYQQTSPQSFFTRKRTCTRMTRSGRITLSDMRLIITEYGKRNERLLTSQQEYTQALWEYFGITL